MMLASACRSTVSSSHPSPHLEEYLHALQGGHHRLCKAAGCAPSEKLLHKARQQQFHGAQLTEQHTNKTSLDKPAAKEADLGNDWHVAQGLLCRLRASASSCGPDCAVLNCAIMLRDCYLKHQPDQIVAALVLSAQSNVCSGAAMTLVPDRGSFFLSETKALLILQMLSMFPCGAPV